MHLKKISVIVLGLGLALWTFVLKPPEPSPGESSPSAPTSRRAQRNDRPSATAAMAGFLSSATPEAIALARGNRLENGAPPTALVRVDLGPGRGQEIMRDLEQKFRKARNPAPLLNLTAIYVSQKEPIPLEMSQDWGLVQSDTIQALSANPASAARDLRDLLQELPNDANERIALLDIMYRLQGNASELPGETRESLRTAMEQEVAKVSTSESEPRIRLAAINYFAVEPRPEARIRFLETAMHAQSDPETVQFLKEAVSSEELVAKRIMSPPVARLD